MIKYWSFWNYTWWLCYKNNLCQLNGPLKTSIIFTSIIGGYIVHIYPRKLKVYFNKEIYYIPYKYICPLDFIFHHYPLLSLLNETNSKKICGAYVLVPCSLYSVINYYRNIDLKDVYEIDLFKIYSSAFMISSLYGIKHHLFLNKKIK